jgi:hypothetical protein
MTDEITEDMQDFSSPKLKDIQFRIDGDVFYAHPKIGALVLKDVLDMQNELALHGLRTAIEQAVAQGIQPDEDTIKEAARLTELHTAKIMNFLDLVLLDESARLFAERMHSATNPIDLEQAFKVYTSLIQTYGGRPTQPSSPSQNGDDGSGTKSTAGAPAAT